MQSTCVRSWENVRRFHGCSHGETAWLVEPGGRSSELAEITLQSPWARLMILLMIMDLRLVRALGASSSPLSEIAFAGT